MKKKLNKIERRKRRHKRIRAKIKGTSERPRLSIYRTNQHIYVQLIDDVSGHTLAAASSLNIKEKISRKEKVKRVASMILSEAEKLGIKKIVFDRSGYSYKGRVKMLAEALREGGLNF